MTVPVALTGPQRIIRHRHAAFHPDMRQLGLAQEATRND